MSCCATAIASGSDRLWASTGRRRRACRPKRRAGTPELERAPRNSPPFHTSLPRQRIKLSVRLASVTPTDPFIRRARAKLTPIRIAEETTMRVNSLLPFLAATAALTIGLPPKVANAAHDYWSDWSLAIPVAEVNSPQSDG